MGPTDKTEEAAIEAAARDGALDLLMVVTVMLTIAPKLAAVWSSLVIFWLCSSQTNVRDCELGSHARCTCTRNCFICETVASLSKSCVMTMPKHIPLTNVNLALQDIATGTQKQQECEWKRYIQT